MLSISKIAVCSILSADILNVIYHFIMDFNDKFRALILCANLFRIDRFGTENLIHTSDFCVVLVIHPQNELLC